MVKYALITGASSGIGYAMAIALTKKGYKVFGCAPEFAMKSMDPLVEKYNVTAFACDITKLNDIKNAVKIVEAETGGKLDILYNNAGIALGGPCIEYDEQDLNKIFQINVIGHINVTKHFAAMVIASQGTIVFTSSIAGFMPLSWTGAYSSTKAAINAYAQTLHMEMKPFGVKVYSVITGGVNTPIAEHANNPEDATSKFYDVDGAKESVQLCANMTKVYSEDPNVYAQGIANKICNKRKNYGFNLYKGEQAVSAYYSYRFFPLWIIQWAIAWKFGQLKVFRNIRKLVKQRQQK